jgi:outer membrane protein TolC
VSAVSRPRILLTGSAVIVCAFVLGACATDAPVSAPQAAPAKVSAAAPAAGAPAVAAPSATAGTPVAAPTTVSAVDAADADQPICKRVDVLGSRVRKERVCKSKSEWALIEQQKRETFRSIDRGASGAGADPALGGG